MMAPMNPSSEIAARTLKVAECKTRAISSSVDKGLFLSCETCIQPTIAISVPPTRSSIVRMKTPSLTGRQQQNVRVGAISDV